MNKKQAVNLAIICINKEIQKLAVDANLFKLCGYSYGEKSHNKRIELKEAIDILSKLV